RPAEVATIGHAQALAFEHRGETRDPQGLRTHGGTTGAGADVGWHPDEADVFLHGGIVSEVKPECDRPWSGFKTYGVLPATARRAGIGHMPSTGRPISDAEFCDQPTPFVPDSEPLGS